MFGHKGFRVSLIGAVAILLSPSLWAALGASVTLSTGSPGNIYPGQTSEIEITLSNSNSAASITGVAFSNLLPGTLPNGLKVAGAASYSCVDPSGPTVIAGSGTLTAALGTQTISLSGGVIPARSGSTDGSCSIRIPVTAGSSSGNARTDAYQIAAGAVTGNDGAPVSNAGTVSQSLNILGLAKPTMSKSLTSTTLTLGGAATTMRITVNNPNPVALANIGLTDVFPVANNPQAGGASQGVIQVANPANATFSCAGGTNGTVSANPGDTTVSAAGGTIAANGSCELAVSVEAKHTGGAFSLNPTNTVNANDLTTDVGMGAASAATRSFTVRSPLQVTKTVNSGSLASGQTGSFTITLTNNGATPLVAGFTDDPIDGVGNAGFGLKVSTGTSTCAGAVVANTAGNTGIQVSNATIPANGSCTVTINFTGTVQTANTPSNFTNSLAAGAVDVGNPSIVSQSASATVNVFENFQVTKSVSPANAAPGNPVRYSVTVSNWSTAAMANVIVNETLTNSQTFLTGVINGIDYTPTVNNSCGLSFTGTTGATNPSFTIGSVPARTNANTPGSCTVQFWAMTSSAAANGAAYANQLAAGSVCYNPGSGNICNGGASNNASGSVSSPALSLAKSFSHGGVTHPGAALTRPEGTIVRMAIVLTNRSANQMTSVAVADTLPVSGSTQMQVASPANAVSGCGGTMTAVPGSTSVSLSGGTIPARAASGTGALGTCSLLVDVVAPAGTYNNTATTTATETYANGGTATVNANSNVATVTYTSSLSAAKTFSPATVSSGGKSTVTIRLNNSGAAALTSVVVTDPLPSGMVLATPPNAYTTCAGTTSVSATAGASTVSMSGGSIAGGGNCDLVFDVTATGSANWVNTIPVGGISAAGGVINQSPVVGTLTHTPPNNPTIVKATSPSTLTFPGQVSRLTVTVTNGTQAVTNLRFTDYFTVDGTSGAALNGMVIAPTPAATTDCPSGIISAVAGGTSFGVAGASLAAGASCTASVNVTSSAVGGVTNFIPAGGIQSDQGLSNTGQASTSLTTQGNKGITKQFTPNVVKPGERSRLRITFFNPVAQPMTAISVTDTLPAGVTVPAGANPATTCTGASVTSPASNQVAVSNGSLPAASGGVSASCYAEIDVLVGAAGDFTNLIPAGASTATIGGVAVSNSQPASDVLRAKAPLVVHKAIANLTLDTGNPVPFTTGSAATTPGTAVTLTIRLENPNATVLNGAAFTDTLPAGLVVATTPNAATTCTGGVVLAPASATSVRLSGATIPANGNCSVTVSVLSNSSGAYTNTIAAGGVTTTEGVTNEEPSSARVVVSTPPTVDKQFVPAVIPPNGNSTLTIVIGNANSSTMTLSSALVDTLPTVPGAITIAATPNVSSTCTGAVTAVAGSGSVTLASGTQVPAGGCRVSVDVTGATSGTHNNNIPAGGLVTNFGSNQHPANASLGISTLGFISGRVFKDNNVVPNGTYEAGTDAPLSGVSIELRSGTGCSGALVSQVGLTNPAVTDALGNYLFSGLPAGTYSVCQPIQPTGTDNSLTSAGGITSVGGSTGSSGVASNPTANSSQVAGIVLNAAPGGEVSGSANNNFAEIVLSGISGKVFLDQNNNGVQNGSDTPLAGVTIELRRGATCAGTLVESKTTAADGSYNFSNLSPDTYSLCQPTQPANTSNGVTTAGSVGNGGTVGSASAIGVVPSFIQGLVLPPNTQSTGNNFAEIPNGRTVSGQVFLDYNNNGLLDGTSDHGLGGQVITLSGTDINGNPVSRTATTNPDGTYSITGLPEGTYTLTQGAQPAGTSNGVTTAGSTGGTVSVPGGSSGAIANINLTGTNTVSANNNFAEQPGAAPDLAINKTHAPSSFGAGSSTGFFTITPRNIGTQPTIGTVTVVDTLPAGMTLAAAATGSGWICVGAVGATTITCTTANVIAANASASPITVRVLVDASRNGQILTNTAVVSGGGEPPGFDSNNTATDPVVVSSTAQLSGRVWLDLDHDRRVDAGEPLQAGWTVELLLNGTLVASTSSNVAGQYAFAGLAPGSGYQVRFRHPTTGLIWGSAVPNEQGLTPVSGVRDTGPSTVNGGVVTAGNPAGAAVTGDGTLSNLTLLAGDNIVEQSLPIDPAGVVYDALTRTPVSGAVVTISGPPGFNPAIHLVGGSATVTTGADGMYQFLLVPGAPAGVYGLAVTTYPAGYVPQPSALIPVCAATLSVPALPNSALVQPQATAPSTGVPAHNPAACAATTAGFPVNSTQYYFSFNLNGASANVLNNHIPLDPVTQGAILVTKTTPLVNVHRGDLVPYTITATNRLSATLTNINVTDRMPPGFKYRSGSATLNGLPSEPVVTGRDMTWRNLTFAAGEKKTWKMILVVGTGVGEAEYTNQAWALNGLLNSVVSNVASATVRVIPDPTFDCAELIGKVFDDKNANGYQDDGEPGIPNVRVVTARGLLITTDADGRYHVACAAIPQMDRGSNFVIKLDERTLPSGYRLTTENPRDVRLTRGKMSKLNFGATVHRVVRLETTAAAFDADGQLAEAWRKQLPALIEQLKGRPSILRISYRGDSDKARLSDLVADIRALWRRAGDDDPEARRPLQIEIEQGGVQ
ncbi:MAG: DUF11 domain-containing protein [Dechloromonas sp.]|nr:MAG: DUF11 domain-containing protein [Dechloromonas sp.]